MKKILLAAPVRQSADVFEEYQKGLDRLIIPEGYSVDRFFIVNDCPEVEPIIRNAAYIIHDPDDEYIKLQNDHLWTEENVNKMSDLRNMTIFYAMKNGYKHSHALAVYGQIVRLLAHISARLGPEYQSHHVYAQSHSRPLVAYP